MTANTVKVKVTKKRLNVKRLAITILVFALLYCFVLDFLELPIKNIYIEGNNILSDKEIISLAELENYPSFMMSYFKDIEKKINTNLYIKNSSIKRKFFGKIYIKLEEERPLFIYKDKLILSSNKEVDNKYGIDYVPYVKNDLSGIKKQFEEKYPLINEGVVLKISEIEYTPNELDKERFLFTMTDSNYVYITLSKIDKINRYNSIVSELNGKKGIINLDSGDYIVIKD